MIQRLVMALLLCEATACAATAPGLAASPSSVDDSCLGPTDARTFAVYLHGVDSTAPSEQEQHNRQVLAQTAEALSIRFALPRAQQSCGPSICWGWQLDLAQRQAAASAVTAAAQRCFPARARYGLVGFSSGGYLVLSLLRVCELRTTLPNVDWSVAVGSAMLRGPIEPIPTDLSACGTATVLIGTDDIHNNDPTNNYLHQLESKHANVSLVSFKGGHELPRQALIDLLATRATP